MVRGFFRQDSRAAVTRSGTGSCTAEPAARRFVPTGRLSGNRAGNAGVRGVTDLRDPMTVRQDSVAREC